MEHHWWGHHYDKFLPTNTRQDEVLALFTVPEVIIVNFRMWFFSGTSDLKTCAQTAIALCCCLVTGVFILAEPCANCDACLLAKILKHAHHWYGYTQSNVCKFRCKN